MIGVKIDKGPQNWQIIQQENGWGKICLSGKLELPKHTNMDDARVAIRVYNENSYNDVIKPVYLSIDNAEWNAELLVPVGGLYTIETFLRIGMRDVYRGDKIFHVGVGDIYVIAGQSNASGTSKDMIEDPISEKVHLFRLCGKWDIATHPISDSTNAILQDIYNECGFHSPWIAFARHLSEELGYPIGLIPSAVGGVPISFWNRKVDGHLFEAMLEMIRLAGGKIKGVLWYQGCNDSSALEKAENYLESFKDVCDDFGKSFYGDIPILTVQLNKSTYNAINCKYWSLVREAQRQAASQIENVFIVPSLDLKVEDTIHNSAHSNLVIAKRLSNVALKYVYHKTTCGDFPNISMAKLFDDNKVLLYFEHVLDALITDFVDVENFMFRVTDDAGIADLIDIECPGNNTLILTFDRAITNNAVIGCDKVTYLGSMPYDVVTRNPILAFSNVNILI